MVLVPNGPKVGKNCLIQRKFWYEKGLFLPGYPPPIYKNNKKILVRKILVRKILVWKILVWKILVWKGLISSWVSPPPIYKNNNLALGKNQAIWMRWVNGVCKDKPKKLRGLFTWKDFSHCLLESSLVELTFHCSMFVLIVTVEVCVCRIVVVNTRMRLMITFC